MARWTDEVVYVALLQEKRDPRYVLPKGGIEAGETLEQAARREIAEEAGLTQLHLLADFGMRERLSYLKRQWKKTHYFLFGTRQIHSDRQVQEPGNTMTWFPIHDLPPLIWPEQKALIDLNRPQIIDLVCRWT